MIIFYAKSSEVATDGGKFVWAEDVGQEWEHKKRADFPKKRHTFFSSIVSFLLLWDYFPLYSWILVENYDLNCI